MRETPFGVYIRTDAEGRVAEITSDAFLSNTSGWIKIDEGFSDRFHHAQGNYLPGPIRDVRGVLRYKRADGEIVERTQEEMDADYTLPVETLTAEEMLEALMGGIADARNG